MKTLCFSLFVNSLFIYRIQMLISPVSNRHLFFFVILIPIPKTKESKI